MTTSRCCRFCLENITGSFLYLKSEDSLKHGTLGSGICFEPILASNFPDLNANLTKFPAVCRKCTDQFMFASLFKFKLSETEDKIQKALNVSKSKRVILRLLVKSEFQRSKLICRTCLSVIKGGKFRPVHSTSGEVDHLVRGLMECFPKINFDISDNPVVVCQACIFESDRYYRFRKRCYETEEVLKSFLNHKSIEVGTIDLIKIIKDVKNFNIPAIQRKVPLLVSTVKNNSLIPLSRPDPKVFTDVKKYSSVKVKAGQETVTECNSEDPLETGVSIKQESTVDLDYLTDENVKKEDTTIDIDYHVDVNVKNKITLVPSFMEYQFDNPCKISLNQCNEDNKSEIHLGPSFSEADTMIDPLQIVIKEETVDDEQERDMSIGEFAECYIKDEYLDDMKDVPEYVGISDDLLPPNHYLSENLQSVNDPEEITQTCVKTCVKCLDTDSNCSHTKKDLVWYTCPICSYQTHWKHHLTRHRLIHDKEETKEKLFHCRSCDYKSAFKHCVMRHNALTHARAFKCSECPFATQFKFTLTEHVKAVHRTVDDLHKCPECSYTSKWKYHIKRHMFRHSFNIGTWNHLQSSNDYVTQDLKENPEKITQTCVKCLDTDSQCFHTKTDLWYKCSICDYQTHWKHHLARHKSIHDKNETTGKLFHCRLCNYQSPFRHCVMRHKSLAHTSAFKCPECPFTTQSKFTLNVHIKTVHKTLVETEKHKCPECSYTSKWKYHIKRHIIYRHSVKE